MLAAAFVAGDDAHPVPWVGAALTLAALASLAAGRLCAGAPRGAKG
jgi:hypothetical protein